MKNILEGYVKNRFDLKPIAPVAYKPTKFVYKQSDFANKPLSFVLTNISDEMYVALKKMYYCVPMDITTSLKYRGIDEDEIISLTLLEILKMDKYRESISGEEAIIENLVGYIIKMMSNICIKQYRQFMVNKSSKFQKRQPDESLDEYRNRLVSNLVFLDNIEECEKYIKSKDSKLLTNIISEDMTLFNTALANRHLFSIQDRFLIDVLYNCVQRGIQLRENRNITEVYNKMMYVLEHPILRDMSSDYITAEYDKDENKKVLTVRQVSKIKENAFKRIRKVIKDNEIDNEDKQKQQMVKYISAELKSHAEYGTDCIITQKYGKSL